MSIPMDIRVFLHDKGREIITFTGQVKADYGDYTLYSDKLLIYYKSKEKGPAATPPPEKARKPLRLLKVPKLPPWVAWAATKSTTSRP